MANVSKKMIAEAVGTFILVFIAVGAAKLLGPGLGLNFMTAGDSSVLVASSVAFTAASTLAIAFAFGAALIGAAYAIGAISGCHINPAVSIGAWAAGRMSMGEMIQYIIAQVAGAVAAAFLLSIIMAGMGAGSGANGVGGDSVWGANILQAAIFEFTATAIFVFVILGVTAHKSQAAVAGLVIGVVLIGIHVVGIPITGTSVNPARSLGPVLFSADLSAWAALPIFLIFPALGGLAAGLTWRTLFAEPEEAKLD